MEKFNLLVSTYFIGNNIKNLNTTEKSKWENKYNTSAQITIDTVYSNNLMKRPFYNLAYHTINVTFVIDTIDTKYNYLRELGRDLSLTHEKAHADVVRLVLAEPVNKNDSINIMKRNYYNEIQAYVKENIKYFQQNDSTKKIYSETSSLKTFQELYKNLKVKPRSTDTDIIDALIDAAILFIKSDSAYYSEQMARVFKYQLGQPKETLESPDNKLLKNTLTEAEIKEKLLDIDFSGKKINIYKSASKKCIKRMEKEADKMAIAAFAIREKI